MESKLDIKWLEFIWKSFKDKKKNYWTKFTVQKSPYYWLALASVTVCVRARARANTEFGTSIWLICINFQHIHHDTWKSGKYLAMRGTYQTSLPVQLGSNKSTV